MAKIHKKQIIEDDVYSLAQRRMRLVYERFDKVVVSFSGGKDSTACVHLALEAAREAGRLPLDVYTFDEEAIPPETVEYMVRLATNPDIRFQWFCIPLQHRNACSRKQPYWYTWNPEERDKWVRELPPLAITELKGFKRGDAIPECTPLIWGADNGTVANVMGIRCQESMTRYQSVATKVGFECFTIPFAGAKWISQVYPIYDWTTEDVWKAPARFGWDYNRAYDRMEAAGVTRQDARCSPPYGEQPIRRLWSYKTCWPELAEFRPPGVTRLPPLWGAARFYRFRRPFGFPQRGGLRNKAAPNANLLASNANLNIIAPVAIKRPITRGQE